MEHRYVSWSLLKFIWSCHMKTYFFAYVIALKIHALKIKVHWFVKGAMQRNRFILFRKLFKEFPVFWFLFNPFSANYDSSKAGWIKRHPPLPSNNAVQLWTKSTSFFNKLTARTVQAEKSCSEIQRPTELVNWTYFDMSANTYTKYFFTYLNHFIVRLTVRLQDN